MMTEENAGEMWITSLRNLLPDALITSDAQLELSVEVATRNDGYGSPWHAQSTFKLDADAASRKGPLTRLRIICCREPDSFYCDDVSVVFDPHLREVWLALSQPLCFLLFVLRWSCSNPCVSMLEVKPWAIC